MPTSVEAILPGIRGRDALITTTLDGRILSWSLGAEALLGHRRADMEGQRITTILHGKFRARDHESAREVGTGRTVLNQIVKQVHADGRMLRCLHSLVPIFDSARHVVAVLRIILDLSPIRQAETALRKTLLDLGELGIPELMRSLRQAPTRGAGRVFAEERRHTLEKYLSVLGAEAESLNGLVYDVFRAVKTQQELLRRGVEAKKKAELKVSAD